MLWPNEVGGFTSIQNPIKWNILAKLPKQYEIQFKNEKINISRFFFGA
jgi:hypothetical protein